MIDRIGIVSYCDHLRTLAHVNHQSYANEQGYFYSFDIAPTAEWRFKAKIEKIAKFLPLFDWVFWIDDDAFIMRQDERLEKFIAQAPRASVIFCESPPNDGKWTWLSSGNFFIKNTPDAAQLLADVLETDMDVVRSWWDEDVYGHFTRGDQDALIYQLVTNPRYSADDFLARLPFEAFNSRPFHFTTSARDQFLVHFTGADKRRQAIEFGERFDRGETLLYWSQVKKMKGVYRPAD